LTARRWLRVGTKRATGMRSGKHALQPSQYGRYVNMPLRRNPLATKPE